MTIRETLKLARSDNITILNLYLWFFPIITYETPNTMYFPNTYVVAHN